MTARTARKYLNAAAPKLLEALTAMMFAAARRDRLTFYGEEASKDEEELDKVAMKLGIAAVDLACYGAKESRHG